MPLMLPPFFIENVPPMVMAFVFAPVRLSYRSFQLEPKILSAPVSEEGEVRRLRAAKELERKEMES